MPKTAQASVEPGRVTGATILLRGQRVLLDEQLAGHYGVEVRALTQAVRRNSTRFPADFIFRLTRAEAKTMRSRSVIASRRNLRFPPCAYTEQGVAMLSSVLRSRQAVRVNIGIMRAFVHLRRMLAENEDLARRVREHERRCDSRYGSVVAFVKRLATPAEAPRRRIGFRRGDGRDTGPRRTGGRATARRLPSR